MIKVDVVIKREFEGDELRIHKGKRGDISIISVVKGKEIDGITLTEEEIAVIFSL